MPWRIVGKPKNETPPSDDDEQWRFTIRLTTTGEKRSCIVHLSASALASSPVPAKARSKGQPALMHFLREAQDDDPPTDVHVDLMGDSRRVP